MNSLDSLVILDILLDRCPSLLAGTATRLLPNLVRLIAQPQPNTPGYRGSKSTATSLIVNPNSRMSTQKWRISVLRRMVKFFEAVASHSDQTLVSSRSISGRSEVITVTDTETVHHCIESSARITQPRLQQFLLRFVCLFISFIE